MDFDDRQRERKQQHREMMLQYLARDVAEAKQHDFILGFKVVARTDYPLSHGRPCPRAQKFAGLYLADELPKLYPANCPDPTACACTLREFVFNEPVTPESEILRARMLALGKVPPPVRETPVPLTPEQCAEVIRMAQAGTEKGTEASRAVWRKVLWAFTYTE
jgi:hypothetical protein